MLGLIVRHVIEEKLNPTLCATLWKLTYQVVKFRRSLVVRIWLETWLAQFKGQRTWQQMLGICKVMVNERIGNY